MSEETKNEMLVAQPRLGKKGMVALITFCNIIAPLSTDMYMPALPEMTHYFRTSDAIVNMTLVAFFFFFAVGMLIFGPISDKNGRKPTIIAGTLVYIAASIGCTFSTTIILLTSMRIIQALGAGCMVAVSTAIVKDQFTGVTQNSVLAIAQVFGVLGPVLSPVIGGQIYRLSGWRIVFIGQAVVTFIIFIVCLLMKETLSKEDRIADGVLNSLSHLGVVLKNKTFALFLFSIAVLQIPTMAYIASSSYIFENTFGLSSTRYSFYFAATALLSVLGPVLYVVLRRKNAFAFSFFMYIVCSLFGALMLLSGHRSPLIFAAFFAPAMMFSAGSRPFATAILLNLQRKDTGAASALINFAFTISGTIGMVVITAVWSDYIVGLGTLMVLTGLYGALTLSVLLKKRGKDSLDVHP